LISVKGVNSAARFASRVLMKGARTLRGENLDDHRLNGERRLLKSLDLPAGAIIFDVGANVGRWSQQARALFPTAAIHAFEPLPTAFAQLERIDGIRAHQAALGAAPGTATLHYDPELTILSSLHDRAGVGLAETTAVEVTTLDDFADAHGIERIDFLKIDVEGHERDVLRGAARRLARAEIGVVQFEYGGTYLDAGVRLREVVELFPPAYTVARVVPWGLMPITEQDLREESFALSNYVAISRR
jgi:FkbM family methyltransferase